MEIIGLLGPALFAALTVILQKGVIDPSLEAGLEPLKKWIGRGYENAKAHKELRKAIDVSIKETTERLGQEQNGRLISALRQKNLSRTTATLLATTAIEMVYENPAVVPPTLLNALGKEVTAETVAVFLFALRRNLLQIDGFREGITYSHQLAMQGHLSSLLGSQHALIELMTGHIAALARIMQGRERLTADDEIALNGYLDTLRLDVAELPLPLVRATTSGVSRSNIKKVYVSLSLISAPGENAPKLRTFEERVPQLSLHRSGRSSDAPEIVTSEKSDLDRIFDTESIKLNQPINISEVISQAKNFILLGPPGSGKSTLLRRVALAFAEGIPEEELGWMENYSLFPVFIRLRNFSIWLENEGREYAEPGPGGIVYYLEHYFGKIHRKPLTPDFFDRRLAEGQCLILMDGLDEVSSKRSEIAQHVNTFVNTYAPMGNRFGITSRPGGFDPVKKFLRSSNFTIFAVNGLDESGIRKLIDNLLLLLETNDNLRQQDYATLTKLILRNRALIEIAQNPLGCTVLVQVYKRQGGALPQRFVDVLHEVVDLLLGHFKVQDITLRESEKLSLEDGTGSIYKDVETAVNIKRSRFSHLAFQMQLSNNKAVIVSDDAVPILSEYLQEQENLTETIALQWAKGFLDYAHERSGLLVELEPKQYAFQHEQYREYLAACAIIDLLDDDFINILMKNMRETSWEQIILMAGAHQYTGRSRKKLLIEEILKTAANRQRENNQTEWLHYLLMAGQLTQSMAEYLPAATREKTRDVLSSTMINVELTLEDRLEAGLIMGRVGWLPDDLYRFIPITLDDGRTFYMSAHPVTNLQYQRFVEADDSADPSLWQQFSTFPFQSSNLPNPRFIGGLEWLEEHRNKLQPQFWSDPKFGFVFPSLPVTGVSWYEANAYCNWLMRHWREVDEYTLNRESFLCPSMIRLPNETEWLIAAGGNSNIARYAWDGFDMQPTDPTLIKRRSNIDNGLGRTSPTNMFPDGKSYPYGFYDMSGNIFEWQANFYDRTEEAYALRGGSFQYNAIDAQIRSRGWSYPYTREKDIGFRILIPEIM